MIRLTLRDLEVVRALVHCVAIFTEAQILDAWWPRTAAGQKNGRRRLYALVRANILARQIVVAKRFDKVRGLHHILPTDPPPDFNSLARNSRESWAIEQSPAAIYSATQRAADVFGGRARTGVFSHTISHSLGVSAIYLTVRSLWPDMLQGWQGEHLCKSSEYREAQPDAFITDDEGQRVIAFEFAADYPPSRFKRLDDTLRSKQLPYMIFGAAT